MAPTAALEEPSMRLYLVIGFVVLASVAFAKEPKPRQSGKILQMESVACGVDENSGKSVVGEIIGTDSAHKKTHELLCQEYVLQSDKVIYRIRPRDEKHPVLLPVGEKAQFRLEKDKMILRVEDFDDKDRQYAVVSMTPRDEENSEKAALK
jgi:hypothetical protein